MSIRPLYESSLTVLLYFFHSIDTVLMIVPLFFFFCFICFVYFLISHQLMKEFPSSQSMGWSFGLTRQQWVISVAWFPVLLTQFLNLLPAILVVFCQLILCPSGVDAATWLGDLFQETLYLLLILLHCAYCDIISDPVWRLVCLYC